ncbi:MAG: hypothetical protein GXO25_05190 [Euryarchaeota archaeon]|nr:hypothetical protein [Euryarchaeota archaeon]
MKVAPSEALNEITRFLEKWYPAEIAPHVVATQLKILGTDENEVGEKEIKLLLSRIEMVILPTYMSLDDARAEVRKLKRKLGVAY